MSIGLRIKNLRISKNLSQDEFATSIGIKRANLGQIELENQLPTIKILSNIVRIYHTSYTFLIDGSFNEDDDGKVLIENTHTHSYPCPMCRDKERIINLLEEKIADQKSKIADLEKASSAQSPPYSQTA